MHKTNRIDLTLNTSGEGIINNINNIIQQLKQ